MQNDNTSFDLLVRSLLQDAEEPVSPRVWKGVSAHLDRLAARQRALLWWKRSGVAVAAAAAVALGIFFAGTHDNSNQPTILTNQQLAVAERPDGRILPERDAATTANVVPDRSAAMPGPSRATAVPAEVVSPGRMDSFASLGMTEGTPGKTVAATAAEAVAETVAEPLPEVVAESPAVAERPADIERDEAAFRALMQEEESGHTRGAALTLGGELQTNGHPSASFREMRRSPLTTPTTGIQELSSQSVYGAPVSFGVGIRFDLSERWAIGTGLSWSILGRTFNGIYSEVDGALNTVKSTSSEIHNTQHYLGVPVNVYFNFVNHSSLRFYTYAGGTFEKNLRNTYIVSALDNLVYRERVDGIQISAGLGMGVEFLLSRHVGLYLDPSVRYYFNCYQPKSIRTQQPLMLNLEAGLRFNLGQ